MAATSCPGPTNVRRPLLEGSRMPVMTRSRAWLGGCPASRAHRWEGRATAARSDRAAGRGAGSSGWVGAGGREVVANRVEIGVGGLLGAAADLGVEGSRSGAHPAAEGAREGELGVGVALDRPAT